MKDLMTRRFFKWVSTQPVSKTELKTALEELKGGVFEASLGGNIYKKRIRFQGRGKRGSGRTIICYKRGGRAIFIHGFAKNEKDNLSARELMALKEFSNILTGLTDAQFEKAIANGDFREV
jgi:hypothetical protein